jgi:hypothetical protein
LLSDPSLGLDEENQDEEFKLAKTFSQHGCEEMKEFEVQGRTASLEPMS